MSHGSEFAMDYPALPDDLWVIWHSNGKPWPDPNRQVSYLSATTTHVMKDFALFTSYAEQAKTFTDKGEAWTWLRQNEDLRGTPYGELHITTVAELKRRCGYSTES